MIVIPEDRWENYHYYSDDRPVFVSFHVGAKEISENDFPHCARVLIPIKNPLPNGGPQKPEVEIIWAMEDELTDILQTHEVRCKLLGRLTHNGTRELVFHLADCAEFRASTGKWIKSHPDYDINVCEHEGWDFFHEVVWPSENDWMWIADRRVIDSLIQSGSDPKKEHSLEFVFRGAPERLREFAGKLIEKGYNQIELSVQEKRLVMVRPMILDHEAISADTFALKQEAENLELEFDGWGCKVVK